MSYERVGDRQDQERYDEEDGVEEEVVRLLVVQVGPVLSALVIPCRGGIIDSIYITIGTLKVTDCARGLQIDRGRRGLRGTLNKFTSTEGSFTLFGGLQLAEGGDGRHANQTTNPYGENEFVSVAEGLPPQRPEGVANGVVPLHGDGHQSPNAHRHRAG